MASGFLYFILAISVLTLIGLIITGLYLFFNFKRKVKDDPFVINFLSSKSKGRFIGIEKTVVKGKGGRHICTIEPKDVDFDKIDEVENVNVIVDKGKIISLSKNQASADKNVKFYLPKKASDFSEELKATDVGKAFMWLTEMKNAIKTEVEILEKGQGRRDEMLKKIGTGEISREFMKFQEELFMDALTSAVAVKEKGKSDIFNKSSGSTNT